MIVSATVYVALLGWVPFVVVLFALLPSRKAAATAVVGGWLLLPPVALTIRSLPDYSKTAAAGLGVMVGSFIFDSTRVMAFRPRWFDLPMLVWCFTGMFASLANDLGLYDGLAEVLNQVLTWGLPYLVGRLYFSDADGLRVFTIAMVIGGISYVIPCLLEVRLSPFIRGMVYGNYSWHGTRLGGWRPDVFFSTGLELGLWMSAASLTAWWLWQCGTLKKLGTMSFGHMLLPALMVTTILCRSTGAFTLQALGMMTLWLSTRFRTRLLVVGLVLVGPIYVGIRATNSWSGQQAVDLAASTVGAERAQSLEYRLQCETQLITKAIERPSFGWGGWGRSDVYIDPDQPWRQRVVTDGLWIIYLGCKGYVGLIAFYMALVLPAAIFIGRFPVRTWTDPTVAPGSVAAMLLLLYMIDCLLNGFPNMIYVTLAGGLAGLDPRQLHASTEGKRVAAATSMDKVALADQNHSLGQALKAEGRYHEAETVWQFTLDLLSTLLLAYHDRPDLRRRWCDCANDLAWLKLHYPELAHGDPSLVIALARRVVEACPEGATYWNTLGAAYFRGGDDALAIAALDRATALGGGTTFDDVFLAMAHARLGNREHAENLLTQVILRVEQDDPRHPELVRFCDEARSIFAESFVAGERFSARNRNAAETSLSAGLPIPSPNS